MSEQWHTVGGSVISTSLSEIFPCLLSSVLERQQQIVKFMSGEGCYISYVDYHNIFSTVQYNLFKYYINTVHTMIVEIGEIKVKSWMLYVRTYIYKIDQW